MGKCTKVNIKVYPESVGSVYWVWRCWVSVPVMIKTVDHEPKTYFSTFSTVEGRCKSRRAAEDEADACAQDALSKIRDRDENKEFIEEHTSLGEYSLSEEVNGHRSSHVTRSIPDLIGDDPDSSEEDFPDFGLDYRK